MDIQKEKHEYLSMLVEHGAITQEQSNSLKLRSGNIELHSNSLVSSLADCINWGWQSWLKAKKQAESALLEQFEINNKLVEQIEKLKADVPGQITITHERLQELITIAVKTVLDDREKK